MALTNVNVIEGRTGKGNRKADGDGISRNDAETLKRFAHWRTSARTKEGGRDTEWRGEGGGRRTDAVTFEFLGRRGHGIGICLPACRKLVTAAVSVVAHKERGREAERERKREMQFVLPAKIKRPGDLI